MKAVAALIWRLILMLANNMQTTAQPPLIAYFWSDDVMRSRSVSQIVLTDSIDIPELPRRLLADWDRELASNLMLDLGDVESMPLARARARWPDYSRCVQALTDWTGRHGIASEIVAASDIALMACRGARYHHDAAQYGSAAFCNVFLSEDRGLDVLFPALDCRIPLTRGTALIFDTAQPHGVVPRGGHDFDVAAFLPERDYAQLFLTWELPIEGIGVAQALKIAFDVDTVTASQLNEEQVRWQGERAEVCPKTGRWRQI